MWTILMSCWKGVQRLNCGNRLLPVKEFSLSFQQEKITIPHTHLAFTMSESFLGTIIPSTTHSIFKQKHVKNHRKKQE
jgi:hypothetical protein